MSDEIEQRRAALAAFVREHGGVASVARHAKVSQTTLYSYLSGKSASLLDRTSAPIASAFGVTVDQLFGVEPVARQVPIAYYVGAGSEVHAFAEGQGPYDYVDAPAEATDNTVAGKIEGVSLGRVLNHALVFWDDVRSPVTQDQHNRLCVVELHDGRVLVKELQPARTPGLFHLFSETEPPILDVPLRWAAVVTSIRPR
ncbi:helix-turn-helix domain-containing protein [Brevundimonas faecalis]|uniref:helix-turn-helix domain-containing protein n=1 Tax=Brevundimonas faecalis TaxID=947378 RepID=UPI003612E928